MPLAATSVQIKNRISPFLNAASASFLSCCLLPPCNTVNEIEEEQEKTKGDEKNKDKDEIVNDLNENTKPKNQNKESIELTKIRIITIEK